jgi:hypothetical protein
MKHRKLRIAWSVACGVLCLLLIMLWVRSYWQRDAAFHMGVTNWETVIVSDEGLIALSREPYLVTPPPSPGWHIESYSIADSPKDKPVQRFSILDYFAWESSPNRLFIEAPHWFLIVVALTLTIAPWLPWRFSLRTLLIGMTVVAVALGLIFALSR